MNRIHYYGMVVRNVVLVVVSSSFLCNGRFCSRKKLCKHYIENADVLQNAPVKIIDVSNQIRSFFIEQGRIKTEPVCGNDSKYYYFHLIQNYNREDEKNDKHTM